MSKKTKKFYLIQPDGTLNAPFSKLKDIPFGDLEDKKILRIKINKRGRIKTKTLTRFRWCKGAELLPPRKQEDKTSELRTVINHFFSKSSILDDLPFVAINEKSEEIPNNTKKAETVKPVTHTAAESIHEKTGIEKTPSDDPNTIMLDDAVGVIDCPLYYEFLRVPIGEQKTATIQIPKDLSKYSLELKFKTTFDRVNEFLNEKSHKSFFVDGKNFDLQEARAVINYEKYQEFQGVPCDDGKTYTIQIMRSERNDNK